MILFLTKNQDMNLNTNLDINLDVNQIAKKFAAQKLYHLKNAATLAPVNQ